MPEEDFDKRLAEEVGSLSTRLVTAVNKQVELEETILHLRKQLSTVQAHNDKLTQSDKKLNEVMPKYTQLTKDFLELKVKKESAEQENTKLQAEVEELTASLFDEANTMVSNASRETHNFKIKNKKLYEELEEKDNIIADLQEQLLDLKSMFIKIEEQSKLYLYLNTTTPKLEQTLDFGTNELSAVTTRSEDLQQGPQQTYQLQQLQSIIYSPNISSIRFDLNNFNLDFKVFVYQLIKPDFVLDLSHLKTLNFFKNIWTNEIENCINHIPSIPSNTLLNRWQKGKTFWSCLIDGKVSIEPVKGTNENFKLTYKGTKMNDKIAPVAIQDPCTFCGESRNDNLEHCRLYHFKIFETEENLAISYPLCNYCVVKLRNLCDFFAKIRLIKSNIFKLKHNRQFDEFTATSFPQFKRSNSITGATKNNSTASNTNYESHNGLFHNIKLDKVEESKLIKLYIMVLLIRIKIFWSKLGFWDNVEQISEVNLDEIHYESFTYLLPHDYSTSQLNTPRQSMDDKNALQQLIADEELRKRDSVTTKDSKKEEVPAEESTPKEKLEEEPQEPTEGKPQGDETDNAETTKISISKQAVEDETDDEEAFTDSVDDFEPVTKNTNLDGLKRSNSTSKDFSKQLNKELDHTLEMLAENMEQGK
ncbi:Rab guanine nucleotide exchange factor SEC2 [Candida viswanathii]|uniref:Rab guanine nucleotide exchange factor SEC2 n=1 Tax=Candida viswanathii TaxID=5486 RepID=A0A367YBB7_9ASCO|nr:Rab guanine nucleotide exchange factor SEC2 [Candida viswanathii]